jgi:hypothetical protein
MTFFPKKVWYRVMKTVIKVASENLRIVALTEPGPRYTLPMQCE